MQATSCSATPETYMWATTRMLRAIRVHRDAVLFMLTCGPAAGPPCQLSMGKKLDSSLLGSSAHAAAAATAAVAGALEAAAAAVADVLEAAAEVHPPHDSSQACT